MVRSRKWCYFCERSHVAGSDTPKPVSPQTHPSGGAPAGRRGASPRGEWRDPPLPAAMTRPLKLALLLLALAATGGFKRHPGERRDPLQSQRAIA